MTLNAMYSRQLLLLAACTTVGQIRSRRLLLKSVNLSCQVYLEDFRADWLTGQLGLLALLNIVAPYRYYRTLAAMCTDHLVMSTLPR